MTTDTPARLAAALDAHVRRLAPTHLRTLLRDADRPGRLALEAGPLHADFSRQRLDEAVLGVRQSAFGFCGQKCSACSRVIVVGSAYEPFLHRLVGATRRTTTWRAP